MAKPANAKGTRDFLPFQMVKRSYIFDTIKSVFMKYGYQCIETPAVEKSETLTGKYGEEGDRLIFRILDNGDYSKKADFSKSTSEITKKISSRALRYDLTVPFARFVAQNRDKLEFPFKRFQIQPVWRADKQQKGRYREFYQCDADVVGSDSLLYEIEQVQILDEVLSKLKVSHTIHINNRKILQAIAEVSGQPDKLIDITIALDKLDKIGVEGVRNELFKRGLEAEALARIEPLFLVDGDWTAKINQMEEILKNSEVGKEGLSELRYVFEKVLKLGLNSAKLNFNVTLARGLNYYTGAIFEVTTDMVDIGSICGGGRYDNLTEMFGMSGSSGVGISFGAARIYDVMEECQIWPLELSKGVDVLIVNFDSELQDEYLYMQKSLISSGLSCEIYPKSLKLGKQMKYANEKNIAYVAIVGSEEIREGIVSLKNMQSGEQKRITIDQIPAVISEG